MHFLIEYKLMSSFHGISEDCLISYKSILAINCKKVAPIFEFFRKCAYIMPVNI